MTLKRAGEIKIPDVHFVYLIFEFLLKTLNIITNQHFIMSNTWIFEPKSINDLCKLLFIYNQFNLGSN